MRRVQRRAEQGSPAVSWRSSSASCAVSAGFFYQRLAPAARLADTIGLEVPAQQLLAALGHGGRGHAEPRGDPHVTAASVAEGLQASVQPALALVEQADQRPGRPPDLLAAAVGCRPSEPSRQHHPPRPQLPAAARRRAGKIQETAVELVPLQTAGADQLAQRVLHVDLHDAAQLGGEASCGCLLHQRLGGSEQGADG